MSEWREKILSDVVFLHKDSFKPDKKSSLNYIGLEHIGQGSLRIESIGNSSTVESNKYYFEKEDVLFGKLRPYFRKVAKAPFDGVCSTDIWVCRAKQGNSQGYIFYFLANQEFVDTANSTDEGTRMPRADWSFLKDSKWIFPPLPEQKEIAEVLSSLDDKIDLLNRQNKTLEALAQTYFRQWFIEEANDNWEEIKITSLFEVKDGTHDSPKQKAEGKKLITSRHISEYTLDFQNAYYISNEDYLNINKRSKVEQFDILFSMIGTIGLTYMEASDQIDYAIKNIGLFKTSQNKEWKYYTYLWLKSELAEQFLRGQVAGSTQEYISLGSLRNITFAKPPYINEFNEEVGVLFEKVFNNTRQIQTLKKLRDTLLPKLISGEVRVTV